MTDDQVRVKASIRFLTADEGGRSSPLAGGGSYRPNHDFFGSDNRDMCMGFIEVPDGERILPGDTIRTDMTLVVHSEMKQEITKGRKWRIQEGGKLVATGTILKVFD